jgi:hypothetical protein
MLGVYSWEGRSRQPRHPVMSKAGNRTVNSLELQFTRGKSFDLESIGTKTRWLANTRPTLNCGARACRDNFYAQAARDLKTG